MTMTREEAINRFKGIRESFSISIAQSKFYPSKAELNELCDMAIESLSAEPSKSTEQNVADVPKGVGRYENAMQKLREMPRYLNGIKAKQIKKISADRPKGEWLEVYNFVHLAWECSKCGAITSVKTPFCYECGADMRPEK